MMDHRFDRGIDPPQDVEPFVPAPEFYEALDAATAEVDLEVRYYAVEQVLLALGGGAVKSEAARNSVEQVAYILTNSLVGDQNKLTYDQQGAATGVDISDCDSFGDDGVTAALILDIVGLENAVARRAALTALALQTVLEVAGNETQSAALTRYIQRARGERLVRLVSSRDQ